MRYECTVVVAITLAAMALPAAASAAAPSRVCPVKGGYVQLQGGIMKDREAPPTLPIGKLKCPTRYFVNVVNHSRVALWIEAGWSFPGKKERPFRSKRVASDEGIVAWKASLGVIEETPIGIHLRFYEDERFRRLIGETRRHLVFEKDDVAAFKEAFWQTGGSLMISGWPDEEDTANKVAGTAAGAQLQADILGRLAAIERTERPDCRMEALRAESFEPEASAVLAKLEGEQKVVAEHRIKEGKARWERWTVRSCDTEVVYEVLGTASPEGGTDLAVAPIPAIPATPDAMESPPRQRGAHHIDSLRRPALVAAQEDGGAANGLVPEESLKDQITLSIPAGWSAHDQSRRSRRFPRAAECRMNRHASRFSLLNEHRVPAVARFYRLTPTDLTPPKIRRTVSTVSASAAVLSSR